MYDVLIIGSGAGGGPLALRLSEQGARVLVLERGPRYAPHEFPRDEVSNYLGNVWVPSLETDPHMVWRRGDAAPMRSSQGWIALCVGGGTVHMGGYLYRFHPSDFEMRSRFGRHAGIADWPYGYDELEPYYGQAEWAVGVSGGREPAAAGWPRSRDLPLPPLDTHPVTAELERACGELGWQPYPTPRSINSRPFDGRPACSYCRLCAGFGCPTRAKGSSQVALIERAEATGNCTVLPRATALEVIVGRDGRAAGCLYADAEGRQHEVRAKVVCVCCSAVESARLLLLSRSPLFPDGLANGNGLVGRFLQFHAVTDGMARFRYAGRDAAWRDPHPFLNRTLADHYFLPAGVSSLAKGGVIRFGLPQAQPVMLAQQAAHGDKGMLWGRALKSALRSTFLDSRTLSFEVFQEYVPNAGTYVELDPEVTDPWGRPVARLHIDPDPHHKAAGAFLQARGLEVFERMGADELLPGAVGETASFLVQGTCRAGHDPATSVLDGYCRSHEVPNLFVVDGSFMPTSGGAAPTLTILANSFRTADHIVRRARLNDWTLG